MTATYEKVIDLSHLDRYDGKIKEWVGYNFAVVVVGEDEVEATAKGDALELAAGSNVTLSVGDDGAITFSATDTTYSEATDSAAGLMSSTDKSKLDGIASGADVGTITGITTTSPLSGSGTSGSVALSHANSGVTAASKGDTSDQTPGFGGEFNVTSGTVNATGHMTAFADHTVTIPNTAALPSTNGVGGANGLLSAQDKEKLDGIAAGATASSGTVTQVTAGAGLTGGPVTSSGTIKADLTSETQLTYAASAGTTTEGRVYPVALDSNGKLAVNVPWTDTQAVSGVKGDSETDYRTGNVNITKGNVGLGNVDNTSDANKPVSTAMQSALDSKVSTSLLGAASGVAQLDANGTVPESQLPSYVDDVMEYSDIDHFPATGVDGKIYVALDTNLTYRWGGSSYVQIGGGGVALGTTHSTAYYGDFGAAAYAHGVTNKGSAYSSGFYKITTNSEGHVTAATGVQKSDITALGIPGSDTTYDAAANGGLELDSANNKFSLALCGTGSGTSGSTTAQTPSFGDTFTVPYVSTDTYGRVSARGEANVTIPSATASASSGGTGGSDGLMTAADKEKLDGISANPSIYFATCSTAASTAAKVATLANDTGFTHANGTVVAVMFQYGNSASEPTLRIDGANVGTGTACQLGAVNDVNSFLVGNQTGSLVNSWGEYEVLFFTYVNGYWLHGPSALSVYSGMSWRQIANSNTVVTTITFDKGTGTGTNFSIAANSGDTAGLKAYANSFTKSGYHISGWKCSLDNVTYTTSYTVTSSNCTLTAQWTAD